MGLDIGIISIEYLKRPDDIAYRFAWEMAIEASTSGYMHGDGNNWGAFTQRQVLDMLDDFVRSRRLDDTAEAEILEWLRSLPWDGWRDELDQGTGPGHQEDYNPVLDRDPEQDGGLIELHFNW